MTQGLDIVCRHPARWSLDDDEDASQALKTTLDSSESPSSPQASLRHVLRTYHGMTFCASVNLCLLLDC